MFYRLLCVFQDVLEVHSYNACGVKYYDEKCFHDLDKIIEKNIPKKQDKLMNFSILVIDEAQVQQQSAYKTVYVHGSQQCL